MAVECKWSTLPYPCDRAVMIVGTICDCATEPFILELCDMHWIMWKTLTVNPGIMKCGKCDGRLSSMFTAIADEMGWYEWNP